jgi:hypothetical protein
MGIAPADFEKYKGPYEEVSVWRKQKIEERGGKENKLTEREKS